MVFPVFVELFTPLKPLLQICDSLLDTLQGNREDLSLLDRKIAKGLFNYDSNAFSTKSFELLFGQYSYAQSGKSYRVSSQSIRSISAFFAQNLLSAMFRLLSTWRPSTGCWTCCASSWTFPAVRWPSVSATPARRRRSSWLRVAATQLRSNVSKHFCTR